MPRGEVAVRRSPRLTQTAPSAGSSALTATSASPQSAVATCDEVNLPSATRRSPRLQSTPTPELNRANTPVVPRPTNSHRHQLVVQPIIKTTFSQREGSGEQLDDVALNGANFRDILTNIWEQFSFRVKRRAVKRDSEWAVEVPTIENWTKLMQFKTKRHLVESTKSDTAWGRWLHLTHGETVILLVYEYGLAITKDSDLKEFMEACVVPSETDRAGSTAESCLHDFVLRLQDQWGEIFQAKAVVWQMWANHLTRNLNRSTWDAAITQPPPDSIVQLLRASDSHIEHHLSRLSQSVNLDLDCVNASIGDYEQLREDWKAVGRRMDSHEASLATRKSIIEAFLRDVLPLPDVTDPLLAMENASDIDHQE